MKLFLTYLKQSVGYCYSVIWAIIWLMFTAAQIPDTTSYYQYHKQGCNNQPNDYACVFHWYYYGSISYLGKPQFGLNIGNNHIQAIEQCLFLISIASDTSIVIVKFNMIVSIFDSPCFEINSQILIVKIFEISQHERSCISYSYEAYYMTSSIMHKFGSQKHVYISLDLRATLRRLKLLQSTFVESCDIACFQRHRK